jgi:hypothetical protein
VTGQKYWCAVLIITVGIAVHPPKNLTTPINYFAATQLRICCSAVVTICCSAVMTVFAAVLL